MSGTGIISIAERDDGVEGYVYSMTASGGEFAPVRVLVEADVNGHVALYSITLPTFSIDGGMWSGSRDKPEMRDVMVVLGRILRDYNMGMGIGDPKVKRRKR